jgi:hypothetical protein
MMLRVEGYEYDVAADFLTARVVRVVEGGGMTEANRFSVEVPVGAELRKLIEGTLKALDGLVEGRD